MSPAIDRRDRIIQLIRLKGPVIPSQINKEVNLDILFASAALGELVDTNILKVSGLKIGGTPLYYLPGQEARLQQFSSKLNEKDKRAYDLLRQQRILRDSELTPLVRVALRNIRDFAKPLNVNINNNTEIFWKWYMLTNEEASMLIRESLTIQPEQKAISQERAAASADMPQQILKQDVAAKIPDKLIAAEKLAEKQPSSENLKQYTQQRLMREKTKKEGELKERETEKTRQDDKFLRKLIAYFSENRIEVIEQKISRKNLEIDFLIKVPSSVGMLNYYCKAKNKQRVNDGDLSSAYLQGQEKKLPILFLTTGGLTKKAKEMLDAGFKGMSIKNI